MTRLLIVDDEEMFLESTADLLRTAGYECDCARDGEDAARMLVQNGPYDVMLADINMPGNARLDLVKALPELAEGLPVVLMTAYPSFDTAVQSLRLPVSAYLTKPFDFRQLLDEVRAAETRSATYRAVRAAQERLRAWYEDLDRLAVALGDPPRIAASTSVEALAAITLENIVGALVDLKRLTESMQDDREKVSAPSAGESTELIHALNDTLAVLEKTKSAFKSKDLGQLRKRLEAVLAHWPAGSTPAPQEKL